MRTRVESRFTPNAAAAPVGKRSLNQLTELKITSAVLPKRSCEREYKNIFNKNGWQKAEKR
ncbi:hypothetical protein SBA2_820011 [Acidobacteriia bacterium SbA2]|nr:hypothetical protein SBA2_820011 [Acidobacteriia bacterium SbA2]